MRRMNAIPRRIAALLLAVFCILALPQPFLTSGVRAVTQADIDAKKKEAEALEAKKKNLEKEIAALANDRAAALRQKNLLDEQIEVIEGEIKTTNEQIDNYSALIRQTEAELAAKEEEEAQRYAIFCARVRAMEENGEISYWETLFKSRSFVDLLTRLDMISEIMDADQRVMESLRQMQTEIAAKKAELEFQRSEIEVQRAALTARQTELEAQRAAATDLIVKIRADEQANADLMDEMERLEAQVDRELEELMRQYALEREGQTESSFKWPVQSRYITSRFGARSASSTNYVGSTNHKGVDVGRVYYTSDVWAAKTGKVTKAEYNNSYGYYVVINHGDGTQTLYAHLSKITTSAGTRVAQGQKIGVTGSTGHSTGPHLHYEIWSNGVRVDPLQYYNKNLFTFASYA
ncbi:MAG: peptidoglycan DD-metalloendopeptidase family protein [Oscillospiraceae bacterium]|nr:peptidoglycan DD-metalloendopeptidase family protein [Oscillospiraceae bacterium]